jgi:hypothetical protein
MYRCQFCLCHVLENCSNFSVTAAVNFCHLKLPLAADSGHVQKQLKYFHFSFITRLESWFIFSPFATNELHSFTVVQIVSQSFIKFFVFLWTLKVHYLIHKLIQSAHSHAISVRLILIFCPQFTSSSPMWYFRFTFPTETFAFTRV